MQEFKRDKSLLGLYLTDALSTGVSILFIFHLTHSHFPARSPSISTPYDNYIIGFLILFPAVSYIAIQLALLRATFQKVEIGADGILFEGFLSRTIQINKRDIKSAVIKRAVGRYGLAWKYLLIETSDQELKIKGLSFSESSLAQMQQAIVTGHPNIKIE